MASTAARTAWPPSWAPEAACLATAATSVADSATERSSTAMLSTMRLACWICRVCSWAPAAMAAADCRQESMMSVACRTESSCR